MIVTWILLACAALTLLVCTVGVWATLKHHRRSAPPWPEASFPPVSLLKPLKGLEEGLEQNLRTFFEQRYPAAMEIVFATATTDDPALPIARAVAREHPDVPARFVISDVRFGMNPKVANLAGAMQAAKHDLVFQSDANVRVSPGYLQRIVGELEASRASLLTSPVVGVGERSIGAAMENLQLSAFLAPGMCTALYVAGVHCVVGKSMLLRKSELREIGGLELVRDVLAEDFVLGERYRALGKTVVLSVSTVENYNARTPVRRFLSRHARWLKMLAVLHLGGFFAELFANPFPLLLAAYAFSGFAPWMLYMLVGATGAKLVLDAIVVRITRGTWMKLRYLCVSPLKEMLMAMLWLHSSVSRTVIWRGIRLRIGKGTRVASRETLLPPAPEHDGARDFALSAKEPR